MSKTRIHCLVLVSACHRPASRLSSRLDREADPYIAGLITKLQREVRQERRGGRFAMASLGRFSRLDDSMVTSDIPPTETTIEFDTIDYDGWERPSSGPVLPR